MLKLSVRSSTKSWNIETASASTLEVAAVVPLRTELAKNHSSGVAKSTIPRSKLFERARAHALQFVEKLRRFRPRRSLEVRITNRDRVVQDPYSLAIAEVEAKLLPLEGSRESGRKKLEDFELIEPVPIFPFPRTERERLMCLLKLQQSVTLRDLNSAYPKGSLAQRWWRLGGCHPEWHKTWVMAQRPSTKKACHKRNRVAFERRVFAIRDALAVSLQARFGFVRSLELRLLSECAIIQQLILWKWAEYLVESFEYPLNAVTPYYIPIDALKRDPAFQSAWASNVEVYWFVRRICASPSEDGLGVTPKMPSIFHSSAADFTYPVDPVRYRDVSRFYGHFKWPFVDPRAASSLKDKLC